MAEWAPGWFQCPRCGFPRRDGRLYSNGEAQVSGAIHREPVGPTALPPRATTARSEAARVRRRPEPGESATEERWEAGRLLPTRSGHKVRSRGEQHIADLLHSWKIYYMYEPTIEGFRPDFILPDRRVIIEYWGGFGREYWRRRQAKTRAFRYAGYSIVGIEPRDYFELRGVLEARLLGLGIEVPAWDGRGWQPLGGALQETMRELVSARGKQPRTCVACGEETVGRVASRSSITIRRGGAAIGKAAVRGRLCRDCRESTAISPEERAARAPERYEWWNDLGDYDLAEFWEDKAESGEPDLDRE